MENFRPPTDCLTDLNADPKQEQEQEDGVTVAFSQLPCEAVTVRFKGRKSVSIWLTGVLPEHQVFQSVGFLGPGICYTGIHVFAPHHHHGLSRPGGLALACSRRFRVILTYGLAARRPQPKSKVIHPSGRTLRRHGSLAAFLKVHSRDLCI